MQQNADFEKIYGISDSFDFERFSAEDVMDDGGMKVKADGGVNRDQPIKTAKGRNSNGQSRSDLFDWVQCLVAALLICVLFFAFFIRIIGIIGDSMNPTFEDGDSVVISNLFYQPKQGDIVVLRKVSFQNEPIIKRVIATEGQTVEIDFNEGIVSVDDKPLSEPYILELTYNQLDFDGSVTVPENQVFVMGDNRNNSLDSRFELIGCVDERYIMGKVLFSLFPISRIGPVS